MKTTKAPAGALTTSDVMRRLNAAIELFDLRTQYRHDRMTDVAALRQAAWQNVKDQTELARILAALRAYEETL